MEDEQRSEGQLLQSETHETTNNTAKTEHDLSSELPIDLSELYGLCMKDIKNRETMRLLKHKICSFGGPQRCQQNYSASRKYAHHSV